MLNEIIATVTLLPSGSPECDNCAIQIASAGYTDCGTLRVTVSGADDEFEVSLNGGAFYAVSGADYRDFPNTPIGSHYVSIRKGACSQHQAIEIYCGPRRCFRPAQYECLSDESGTITGFKSPTHVAEFDCLTNQSTGRTFPNDGSVTPIYTSIEDRDQCPPDVCMEYTIEVVNSNVDTVVAWTDCTTDEESRQLGVATGEPFKVCSKSVPFVKNGGSIQFTSKKPCCINCPPGYSVPGCCQFLVVINGNRASGVPAQVRYRDCETGQTAYRDATQGQTLYIFSREEPVIISSLGGSVEVSGDCEDVEMSTTEPVYVFRSYCVKIGFGQSFSYIDQSGNTLTEVSSEQQDTVYNVCAREGSVVGGTITNQRDNCNDVLSICDIPDNPQFTASVVQPYCDANTNVSRDGALNLTGVLNATRYRICYASSFNCVGDCASSDGLISGAEVSIPVASGTPGQTRDVTVRVYNGSSCLYYTDHSFKIYTQNCANPEITHLNFDFTVYQNGQVAVCDQPNTYTVEYNMYAKLIAPAMAEHNQTAVVGPEAAKNIPNGNSVPNVLIAAALKAACGGTNMSPGSTNLQTTIYRFAANLNEVFARYPLTTSLSIEIWGERTKSGGASPDVIQVRSNTFPRVRTIKTSLSNGAFDFSRDPIYDGTATVHSNLTYNSGVSGARKLGTFAFNRSTQTLTWTPA